ncbi:hypothetical protein FIBSPDRAFT_856961 [Athelia psychrophila]|uniref:Uncharacterized protein n=1 Tax=Athelia psychrophila TaxID=1759441 RepID=A0A166MV83_9AGAM|nr:hypothetical protein FIBSPDRAFT_856961 [Fibularhizoctonia sp. CBS 109695]
MPTSTAFWNHRRRLHCSSHRWTTSPVAPPTYTLICFHPDPDSAFWENGWLFSRCAACFEFGPDEPFERLLDTFLGSDHSYPAPSPSRQQP